MSGVIVKGSISAVITYIIVGTFGYLCFATYPDPDAILKDKNILQVDVPAFRKNAAIIVVNHFFSNN